MDETKSPQLTVLQLTEIAQNIIRYVGGAIRNMRIYPLQHPIVQKLIENTYEVVRNSLKDREELSFHVAGNVLLIEKTPIKESKKELFINFITELSKRRIAGLTFLAGISKDELVAFLGIMAMEVENIDESGGLTNLLVNRDVTHVIVEEFQFFEGGRAKALSEGVVLPWKDVLSLLEAPAELQSQAENHPEMIASLIMKTAGPVDTSDMSLADQWTSRAVDALSKVADSLFALYGRDKPQGYVEALSRIAVSMDPIIQERLVQTKWLDPTWAGVIENIVGRFSDDKLVDIIAGEFNKIETMLEKEGGVGGEGGGIGGGGVGGVGVGVGGIGGEGVGIGVGGGGGEGGIGGIGGEVGIPVGGVSLEREKEEVKELPRDDKISLGIEAAARVEDVIKRLLADPERRERILPLLRERLAKLGIKSDKLLSMVEGVPKEEMLVSLIQSEIQMLGHVSAETLISIRAAIRGRVNARRIIGPFIEAISSGSVDVRTFTLKNILEICEELITLGKYDLLEELIEKLLNRIKEEIDINVYAQLTETLERLTFMLLQKGRHSMAGKIIDVLGEHLRLFSERPAGKLILQALGKIPDDSALRHIGYCLSKEGLRKDASEILVTAGKRAVTTLLGILDISEDRETRLAILSVLVKVGSEAIEVIQRRLNDERWYVRRNACLLLSQLADKSIVDYLVPHVRDGDPRVRIEAVKAVEKLGGRDYEEALIDALDDKDSRVKLEIVRLLGKSGGEKSLFALTMMLERKSLFGGVEKDEVKEAACISLGEIGDRRAAETLRKLSKDKNPQVSSAARASLRKLGLEFG